MTFGSTFGRTFSPTFQPKSQAAASAANGWWDLDGTITSCVAAYQPKGAASYAASLVNLTGNTTYDATEGNAPDWDATNGWEFAAANSDYLKTGVTPDSLDWSAIIALSNLSTADQWAFGYYTTIGFGVIPNTNPGQPQTRYYNGGERRVTATRTSGIFAIAKNQGYYNGSTDGSTFDQTSHTAGEIWIGDISGSYRRYLNGYVQAFAIYNATLTSTQIGNLTTAMAAL